MNTRSWRPVVEVVKIEYYFIMINTCVDLFLRTRPFSEKQKNKMFTNNKTTAFLCQTKVKYTQYDEII